LNAILKIIKTPEDVGGDTLWASGYEAFDRLSPVWQRFAEGLTATHYQVGMLIVLYGTILILPLLAEL
jgi:alpha-ketoglutarate-dependent taurine dioxygenase